MKKSKIIGLLGLSAVVLSLSACSNNASNRKSSSQPASSKSTSKSNSNSKNAELASSKKNAEELANALKTDKVNFKGYMKVGNYVNEKTHQLTDQYDLPAPEPSATVSSFAKKHNLNKEQKDTLKSLDLDQFTEPNQNDDGSLVAAGVFGDASSITAAYFTVSDVKVEKDDVDNEYVIKAKVTQHLENNIDTSTVSIDKSISVSGK